MFELRDIQCFIEIVEHRGFGKAAAALGMTQPALSRRIAVLERDVGATLFSRARRQIELTPAGEVFAREAVPVLAQAATAERAVRDAAEGRTGHLRLGTRSTSRFILVPAALRIFRDAYPNVLVAISDPPVRLHLDHLRKGEIDMTVLRGPIDLAGGLRSELLRSDPLVVALPQDHRLAASAVVDGRELREDPFVEIAFDRAYGYRELVRGVCAQAGFLPKVALEVDTLEALIMCVGAGIGIGLMHDAGRELPAPGVVYRPLRPEQPALQLQAIWRAADDNPVIPPFVQCLKSVAASFGAESRA